MSLSIQTNVASLTAQENLRVNSNFQSQTIQRLTSGYRINSAADDAAGLAVANTFRNNIAELSQGVRNASDGIAQLQIADGGLTNISNILDRLKTLATQSSTNTFTGDRATLNSEYQSLLSEVTRQAGNIGMVQNGSMNKQLQVYIGGGSSQTNAQVSVDLSGTANQVDAAGLGIGTSNITAGGVTLVGNTVSNLNNSGQMVLGNNTGGQVTTETFTLSYISNGQNTSKGFSVTGTGSGITVASALSQLNSQLSTIGLSASVNDKGAIVIGGSSPFALVSDATTYGTGGAVAAAGSLAAGVTASATTNLATYNKTVVGDDMSLLTGNAETLAFSNGAITKYLTIGAGDTNATQYATDVNTQLAGMGIFAVATGNAREISIQSNSNFSVTMIANSTVGAANKGLWGAAGAGTNATNITAADTTVSSTGNALASLSAIQQAVLSLGKVQGKIGAGENALNYAINLANSQITNFSSAQAQIRDADVAQEAANLTKAQVLQQASIAAMAQANSAPQAVLSLLKG